MWNAVSVVVGRLVHTATDVVKYLREQRDQTVVATQVVVVADKILKSTPQSAKDFFENQMKGWNLEYQTFTVTGTTTGEISLTQINIDETEYNLPDDVQGAIDALRTNQEKSVRITQMKNSFKDLAAESIEGGKQFIVPAYVHQEGSLGVVATQDLIETMTPIQIVDSSQLQDACKKIEVPSSNPRGQNTEIVGPLSLSAGLPNLAAGAPSPRQDLDHEGQVWGVTFKR